MHQKKTSSETRKALDPEEGRMWHIYKIMEKINSSNDINVVARDIVDLMTDALDCIGGALFIVDEKAGILRPFTYSRIGIFIHKVIPLLPKAFQDHIFDLKKNDNYTIRTVTEKRVFIGNRYDDFMVPVLSKFLSRLIQKVIGMKTIVSAPTIVLDKVVGVFQIAFREKEISEEKKRLMKLFSDQCAVAINNAQEYEKLQSQYKKMKEILAQQSDFIAVTAHELRTPLSIAIFQLEELMHSKNKPKKYLEELRTVESSLENLKELTEKLFTVQQYDLKKVGLNLEEVEMSGFLKQIYKDFSSIMKEKTQQFNLIVPNKGKFLAKIDQIQMRQVFHNVLKNAHKFTPQNGQIDLKLEKKKHLIRVTIQDNGVGIPDALKKSIFEKFRTKSSGAGIGLGLYLCKKIVELHKGKLWAEDAKKGGAVFCLELPLLGK